MIAALLTSLIALAPVQDDASPHPALSIKKEGFELLWKKAFEDGQKKRDVNKAIDKGKRQIDSYHVSKSRKSGCAWAYFLHPRLVIYQASHNAAKQYWEQAKVDEARADLAKFADSEWQYVGFYVVLNEMPSFAGGFGRMSREADPDNLTDVRCVLKVGDRIIQPTQQPGDLTIARNDGVNFFSVPTTTYVNGSSNANATINYSNGAYAQGTGSSTTSYRVTTYNEGQQGYTSYEGEFTVLFPTRDANGKPTITAKDKEIQLIVVKKSAELKATYSLAEWQAMYEK